MNVVIKDKCAACGKGGDRLKTCAACKMVKYCSVACQRAHRPKHKKECRRRAAELHDEALFRRPVMEECPICTLPMSCGVTEAHWRSCCGKTLCHGCVHAVTKERMEENRTRSSQNRAPLPERCPFCRAPAPASNKEVIERIKRRMDRGDADAYVSLGRAYIEGWHGLAQDEKKGFELWRQGSEIGSAEAYNAVGMAFFEGLGVQRDEKRAFRYMELAAMEGDSASRHNLGTREAREYSNLGRAVRHWIIAAGGGFDESLDTIKRSFMLGNVSKADYERALRAHKDAANQINSTQRAEAAAATAADPDESIRQPRYY